MPEKPSENEEEYFARLEFQKRKQYAEELRAKVELAERERERTAHFMKCPKCGSQLEEINFGGVKVDKCFHCGGMWLDDGELERLHLKEPGFLGRMLGVFRS